jgi:hypothetical protein
VHVKVQDAEAHLEGSWKESVSIVVFSYLFQDAGQGGWVVVVDN